MKVLHVVGARPNFVKIAPIMKAMDRKGVFEQVLLHTGQHYDAAMSDDFFRELSIPAPNISLEISSAPRPVQISRIMAAFEVELKKVRPDMVVVVGDVNSTLACALAASAAKVPLAHIEAGLRSFDRDMPEETNRVITDRISDILFTTEPAALDNLALEGVVRDKVHLVGNVMIDTLMEHKRNALKRGAADKMGMKPKEFALISLHRPSNVDSPDVLGRILGVMEALSRRVDAVFPMHPRTKRSLDKFGLSARLDKMSRVKAVGPVGYLDFVSLMSDSCFVMTDSGGVQEETSFLSVPCLTLRDHTERPITLTHGTNVLVGTDPARILHAVSRVLDGESRKKSDIAYWDGRASERIADILAKKTRSFAKYKKCDAF